MVIQPLVDDVDNVGKLRPDGVYFQLDRSLGGHAYGLKEAWAISSSCPMVGPQSSLEVASRTLAWISEYPFVKFFLQM